jgi:hypothetical protein
MLMAEEYRGITQQSAFIITYLRQWLVAEEHQRDKQKLIKYAEKLLTKAISLLKEE